MDSPTPADLDVPAPLAIFPWDRLLTDKSRALYVCRINDVGFTRHRVYLSYNWRHSEMWVLEWDNARGAGQVEDEPEQLAAYITAFLLTGAWPHVHEPETD